MENKQSLVLVADNIISKCKSILDPALNKTLNRYSFENEVKLRYEGFQNFQYKYYSFGISIIFVQNINDDDYGIDISFKIIDDTAPTLTSYIARGNGSVILHEKKIILHELANEIDDLIDEYTKVSDLLIKEYVLEKNTKKQQ